MYRNLNPQSLGVSGRQSELIELTLTYGFRSFDLDAGELLKRATLQGIEEATRYIQSGKVKVSGWTLPVDIAADEDKFNSDLEKLAGTAETAVEVGFSYATVKIEPKADTPYPENFERHRERLAKAGDVLAKHGMRLGVGFRPVAKLREDAAFPFIHRAEEVLTLVKNTGSDSVGLALDTWDWKVGGGGNDQLSELASQQIVSVSIADMPPDVDFATIDETQRLLPTEETLADYVPLVRLLAEGDYEGPITILPHSGQLSRVPRDLSVDKCAIFLDQLWKQVGLNKAGKLIPATAET